MKLSDLVKPKWQHSDPEVRQRAVASGTLDASTLSTIVREDDHVAVREAAIERSSDTGVLLEATRSESDQHTALRRLGVLLTTVEAASPLMDALPASLRSGLLAALRDTELQLALLQTVLVDTSVESLLELPLPAAVQSACVDTVKDKARLSALREAHAGRNKSVHRRAEECLAEIAAEEARKAAFVANCGELASEFETLAAAPWDGHLATRLDLIEKRWAGAADASDYDVEAPLLARVQTARDTIGHTLVEMPRRIGAAGQAATNIANALTERITLQESTAAVWDDLAGFCAAQQELWNGVDQTLLDAAVIEPITSQFERLNLAATRFASVAALEPADDLKGLRAQLASINWPAGLQEPESLAAMRTTLAQREAAAAAQAQADALARAEFVAALEALEKAVDAGDLASAREADKLVSRKTPEQIDRDSRNRLSAAQKRLRDLRDWQGFATVPKRQALCETMESLAAEDCTDVPGRAAAVKLLQNDWKALGRSDSPVEQRLWRRFRKAADAAYAPCKAHFDNLEAARNQNLIDADAMCGQLETFLNDNDWKNADWPGIRKILRTSREGFQKLSDLPRRAVKPVRDRFNKATRAISAKVQEEERRNEALKQSLIDDISSRLAAFNTSPDADGDGDTSPANEGARAEQDSLSSLINLAKDAQRRWREIGITRYKKDKQLWTDFRARCDDVFALREVERKEVHVAEAAVAGQGDQICAELEQVMNADDQDQDRIRDLQRAFDNLNLPRGAGKVRKRFDALKKRLEASRREAATEKQRAELDTLKSCAASCAEAETNPGKLDQAAANIEQLPPHLRERMASRVAETREGINGNLAANGELAETLCVRAEMLAAIPSPPEATQLRLKLQVDTLNDKFSRGQVDNRAMSDRFRELQVDWYCLGPLDAELRSRLESRFQSAEQAVQA